MNNNTNNNGSKGLLAEYFAERYTQYKAAQKAMDNKPRGEGKHSVLCEYFAERNAERKAR